MDLVSTTHPRAGCVGNNSEDSRYHQDDPGHGFVPYDDVTGRAFIITWPTDRWIILDNHPEVFAAAPTPCSTACEW